MNVKLFVVVAGQNRLRGTFGQLAQVPLLHRPHPTTNCKITLHSCIITHILLLSGPRNVKMDPLQLPTKRTGTGTAVTGARESR